MRIMVLLLGLATGAWAAPATNQELLGEFRAALTAKDLRAMVALYDWQGVSKEMRTTTAMMLDELTRKEIKEVALGRVTQKKEAVVKGVRFRPNLPLAGAIVVTFTDKGQTDRLEIPYGKKANAFYLASVTEEQVGPVAAKPRQFGISVGGTAAPKAAQFTGFYVAIVKGKEVRKDFSGQAGLTKQIAADSLKYVEVRKTSADGSIYLLVTQDGTTLFESAKTETGAPITFGGSR